MHSPMEFRLRHSLQSQLFKVSLWPEPILDKYLRVGGKASGRVIIPGDPENRVLSVRPVAWKKTTTLAPYSSIRGQNKRADYSSRKHITGGCQSTDQSTVQFVPLTCSVTLKVLFPILQHQRYKNTVLKLRLSRNKNSFLCKWFCSHSSMPNFRFYISIIS